MDIKKYLKQWVRASIFVVVMLSVVFLKKDNAYAVDYAIEHSLNAVVYNTNSYAEGGGGVALTANGGTLSNWDYTESRYLQVNIMVVAKEDEVHVVEIQLPSILYAVNDIEEVPNGYSKVEFKKNEDILTNNGRVTYKVNKRSGTVKYYLKPNMTKATIQMELRYDTTLWDKFGGSPLTSSDVNPIKVSINHEKEIMVNEFEQNAAMQRLSKATTKTSLASSGAVWYKRNWNESLDYWDASDVFQGHKDDKVRTLFYSNGQGNLYLDKYYKKIRVEVSVPYIYSGGKKWYLEYDDDTFIFNGAKEVADAYGTFISGTKSKVVYYIDDFYGRDGRGITIDFNWPSGFVYYGEQASFANGNVKIYVVTNAGQERLLFSKAMGNINYQINNFESVYSYGRNFNINNTIAKYPEGAITKLGAINICNSGTADSVPKTLQYRFHSYQLVSAINLPTEVNVKEYTVNYKLKDENGNVVYLDSAGNRVSYNGTSNFRIKINNDGYGLNKVDNIFTQFKITDLPSAHQKYYFAEISYTLGTIRRRCHLNSVGEEMNSVYSANVYFGKVSPLARLGTTLRGYLVIKSAAGSGIGDYKHTIESKVVNTSNAPYGVDSATFSRDTLKAGESVYTSGKLMIIDWFYGADCTWMSGIRVGIELPEGVTINKSDVDIRTPEDNKKVEIVGFKTKKKGNKTIYMIDLPEDFYVGYYSRDMKALENGGYLNYTIKLRTDRKMEATTLFTDQMMYLAPKNQINAVAQNRIMYAIEDKWDLNENRSTTDMVGRAPVKQSMSCSIAANPTALDISDSINIIGEGSVNGMEATTYNKNDVIQYNLNVSSNNDGKASSFTYYIPVPRKNSVEDGNVIVSAREDAFDLQLINEVVVTGDDIYKIEYCTKEMYTYDTLREFKDEEWYEYSELNLKDIKLNQITAIKVSINSGSIEKGMDTTITVNMKYLGDTYYKELGLYNEWKSCGYYDYDDGVKILSGHYATSGVKVILDGEEKINNIQIGGSVTEGDEVGEESDDAQEDNNKYGMYEVIGYTNIARTTAIPLRIERQDDSIPVELVFSYSPDYKEKSMYVDGQGIIIMDEFANKVVAIDGVYRLNANKNYRLVLKGDIYRTYVSSASLILYLHSLDGTDTVSEKISVKRIAAFVEY